MILAILVLAGYWLVLIHQLGAQWSAYEQYNYGWAVPVLCLYLVWERVKDHGTTGLQDNGTITRQDDGTRDEGRTPNIEHRTSNAEQREQGATDAGTQSRAWSQWSCRPVVLWSLLCLFALAYAPTRLLHEANPIWRFTSLLLALEVIAITLLLVRIACQVPSARCQVSCFTFPICFFLVAVPWPSGLESFLVQHLTRLNVSATVEALGFLGIPALQHANTIEVGSGIVGVDDACSGIRSFQAALMIALFFGELYRLSLLRRVGLCLSGFALSFLFNVGRTTLLTCVAARQGTAAIAHWHDPAGVTILVGCFLALWVIALLMRTTRPQDHGAAGPGTNVEHPTSNIELPTETEHHETTGLQEQGTIRLRDCEITGPGANVEHPTSNIELPTETEHHETTGLQEHGSIRLRDCEITGPGTNVEHRTSNIEHRTRTEALSSRPVVRWSRPLVLWSLLAWLLLVEVGTELWYRSHEHRLGTGSQWSLTPEAMGTGFNRAEVPPTIASQFHADESMQARWQDEAGNRWQLFYFRWVPAHSLGGRFALQSAKVHGPEVCLPAIGMSLKSYVGVITVPLGDGKLALQQYVFTAEGKPIHVFYGIYEDPSGPAILANRRQNAASRLAAALAGSRNYGQSYLELAVSGMDDPQEAQTALQHQLERLIRL